MKTKLQQQFESNIAKDNPGYIVHENVKYYFTVDATAKYIDPFVAAMYKGYCLAVEHQRKANKLGLFVLSSWEDHCKMNFNPNPYRHSSFAKAVSEAERMAEEHNKSFIVFKSVVVVKNKNKTPSEV